MRVRVLFFGILKDMVGKSDDLIDLPEGSSVREVLAALRITHSAPEGCAAFDRAGGESTICRS